MNAKTRELVRGQPRAVFRGLINVFFLKLRAFADYFIGGGPVSQEFEEKVHGDPGMPDGRFSLTDPRIHDNTIEHAP